MLWKQANPLSRIVNGDKAANYQFPWHVSLQATITDLDDKRYCGGILIANNFVLTAASCVHNAATIQADYGSIHFSTPFETQHSTQYQIHPQYNADYKSNNLAIIRLPTSVVYRSNVRAILLPRISEQNETFESIDSYISGFGVSQPGSNYLSNDLNFAHQTVISNELCRQSYDSRYVQSTVMCAAGYNGSTASICYGDQGGALVSHIDGSWVAIGVASIVHSTDGCQGRVPALYTRIAPYLPWIQHLTGIVVRP